MKNLKYILYVVCGLLAFAPALTSCQDKPMEDPAEEIFLREFIKKYGLIDPNQDWNQAERTSVKVIVPHADQINVLVYCANHYYRVAMFFDIDGEVEIPMDIPEDVDTLYVEIDGHIYETTPGGTVNANIAPKAPSKLPSSSVWINDWSKGTIEIPNNEYVPFVNMYCVGDPEKPIAIRKDRNYELSNLRGQCEVHFQIKPTVTSPFYFKFKTLANFSNSVISVVIVDAANNIILDVVESVANTGAIPDDGVNNESAQLHTVLVPHLEKDTEYQVILSSPLLATQTAGVWGAFQFDQVRISTMSWLMVAEDLGATDDFDFNDVIINVQAVTTNRASAKISNEWWQVIEDDNEHLVLQAPGKSGSRDDDTYTKICITPLSAGGILDSYLHFCVDNNDYVLKPGTYDLANPSTVENNLKVVSGTDASIADNYTANEWHSWFDGGGGPNKNQRQMLNTGYGSYLASSGSAISAGDELVDGNSCTLTLPGTYTLTEYSQIFVDYDGNKDNIGTTTANGANTNYGYQSDAERMKDDWHYVVAGKPYVIKGFYITVEEPTPELCNYVIGAPKKGKAPQMFLIPDVGDTGNGLWRWPHERVDITDVYPKFVNWVNKNEDTHWYMAAPTERAQTKEGKKAGDYEWVKAYVDRNNH